MLQKGITEWKRIMSKTILPATLCKFILILNKVPYIISCEITQNGWQVLEEEVTIFFKKRVNSLKIDLY